MQATRDSIPKNGFFLDEKSLRRIHQIISNRGRKLTNTSGPSYQVFRADAFSYQTENIDEIIKEDNSSWNRITRIKITMRSENQAYLLIIFDEKGTTLHVEGKNQDIVDLLFSDLNEYLNHEVTVLRKKGSEKNVVPIFGVIMVIMVLVGMYYISSTSAKLIGVEEPHIIYSEALGTNQIDVKMNYLIETIGKQNDKNITTRNNGLLFLLFVGVSTIFYFGTGYISRTIEKFDPINIFVFGKEIEMNFERKKLRQNLKWSVFIGSIVSIFTGLLVWLITKNL